MIRTARARLMTILSICFAGTFALFVTIVGLGTGDWLYSITLMLIVFAISGVVIALLHWAIGAALRWIVRGEE